MGDAGSQGLNRYGIEIYLVAMDFPNFPLKNS